MFKRHTVAQILEARTPHDIFGELPSDSLEAIAEVQRVYRALARETHPDTPDGDAVAFSRLSDLFTLARKLVLAGTYSRPGLSGLTVKTKVREYIIEERLFHGDIADIYKCSHGLISIAHVPRDNDLLRTEAKIIRAVCKATEEELKVYLPELLDSFSIRDSASRERHANVFKPLLAFNPINAEAWYPLSRIIKAFPKGIDPRDAAWIWRRMLISLALAHEAGYVHHAALPSNFMIQPPEHGVILMGWTSSVQMGEIPHVICREYKGWYPDEVISKEPSTPATDIYMAALAIIQLMGGNPQKRTLPDRIPTPLRAYFRACTLISASKRSDDARRLLDSYDNIITRLWGPRKFREFNLPATI